MAWFRTNKWAWQGYAVAVAAVALATIVRIVLLGPLESRAVYVTFFPAVILAALYGGGGEALAKLLDDAGFTVVGQAASGAETVRGRHPLEPA